MVIQQQTPRYLLFFFVLAIGLPTHIVAAPFTAQVATQQIEFGKPLLLTLSSSTTRTSLDTLALTALQENFAVKPLAAPEINQQTQQQIWQLHLYAYHVGQIHIPTLHFANRASQPINLIVTPPVDAKTQTAIAISTDISTTKPWYKQQVLVTRTFTTTAPIVVLETLPMSSGNVRAIPLLVKREASIQPSAAVTHHTIGWAVFALQHGPQTIALPPVAYIRDGVRSHLFYLKPLALHVKPLPTYLPATLAIGKLQVNIRSFPRQFLFSQQLAEAQLQLSGEGLLVTDLPLLTPQLHSSDAITLHPHEQRSTQTAASTGIKSVADYRLPFSLHSQGAQQLPTLRIQYFDPASGKIHTEELIWPRLLVINPWLATIIGLIVSLLLLRGAWFILKRLHRQWHCLHGYRRAVLQLAAASTPHAIKQVFIDIAHAERWPVNLTLAQWNHYWLKQHPRIHFNPAIINELSQSLYNRHTLDLYRVKQTLLNLCRSRWPYLSHLFNLPM